MKNSLIRREFLKTAALSGASMALFGQISSGSILPFPENIHTGSENFSFLFNHSNNTFSIWRSDGSILLQNGTTRVNTGTGSYSYVAGLYRHRVKSQRFTNQLGTGHMVRIFSEDSEHAIDIEMQIALFDRQETISIETICKNVSTRNIIVSSLEPVLAIQESGGFLVIPGVSKCITNGAMYYDAGMIHTFGTPFVKPEPYGETKGGIMNDGNLSITAETVHSWWNAGFFSGYDKEGLVIGYIENRQSLGQLQFSRLQTDQVCFIAESVFNPGLVLKPGQSIRSDRVVITIGQSPYKALESYAAMTGTVNKARTHSIINGWCNWFYTYEHVTEEEIIRNAEFTGKHLKKYGMEYIQIDEGYQKWHGDWEGNERFPHGMKWLADRVKEYGLKAGIWVAPYVVSEPAQLFRNNPEWFLKNADGSMKRVGPWPAEDTDWARNEYPRRYGLDITHPEAAQWLHNLIDTMVNRWGYDMIKVDFVAWSLLSAHHYYDDSFTPAQAYRKGYETMRSAAGEKCHFLECGPGAVSTGLIDSMRIELDQNYGYSDDVWKQYFLHSASSGPASAKRYYFHKRTWNNDADHICINLLSPAQSQAAATIIALSGGNVISGDRLTELDVNKLSILAKIVPAFGEAARPVDLFDTDLQSVFALTVVKPFGEWTVAGFFNASLSEEITHRYPLERLWLLPDRTYLAYDFWKEKFIGEVSGEICIKVPPGSVTLLTLHEKSGLPQFISTSRHVLQGAIELEQVDWNTGTQTLTGISKGPLDSSHFVVVYLPEPKPWKQSGQGLFRDYGSYSLNMVDNHIARVWLHFKESERLEWKIEMNEL
jgi:hypothetical protein